MNIKFNKNPLFDFAIICVDVLLILLSCFLSHRALSLFVKISPISLVYVICYVVVTIFMLYIYEFYTKLIRRKYEIILSIFLCVLITNIVVIVLQFIFGSTADQQEKLYVLVMPAFSLILISVWKLILLLFVKRIEGTPKLLVIESSESSSELARKVKYSYVELYEAWYTQIDVQNEEEINNFLETEFNNYESIFISPSIPEKLRNVFISKAIIARKEIFLLPDLYNISVMKNETVQFDDTPSLRIKPFGLTKFEAFLKRTLDIVVSLVGIIITLPITIIAIIAIRLDSKGAAIYKQERVTIDRKPFNIYKFRTMIADAEKNTGPTLASDSDPRITKVGRLLRATRLDELPQLFNILFGSMSIVGPRPERLVFVEKFCEKIENYDKRFFVKAGLTGLAQVYSRYDTSASDKTLYDLLYIKDYSFWLDIKLILLTLKIMFVRESSDGVKPAPVYQKKDS